MKIKDEIKDFFKNDNRIVISELLGKITATYNDEKIILDIDEFSNKENLYIEITILMPNKKKYKIFAKPEKDEIIEFSFDKTEEEKIIDKIKHYNAFSNKDDDYSLKYFEKGKQKEFNTISDLLSELLEGGIF